MSESIHPLLKRQLKKYSLQNPLLGKPDIIEAINETYWSNDEERKLLERSLEISSEELMQKNSQMKAIFEAFPDIFLRIGLDGKILDYKSAASNFAKILPSELIGRHIKEIMALQINTIIEGVIKRVHATGDLVTLEHVTTYKDKKIYFETRIISLQGNEAIIIIRDITGRKVAEEQLKFDAIHDRLTLLPNRTLLLERIRSLIQRKKRNPAYNFSVIFVDFDRFKLINDSLGHLVGDELLIEISKRLLQSIRGVDTLARLGGDEFCIALDDVKTENDVSVVAERIQKSMNTPFSVNNREIYITLSAGIVLSNNDEIRNETDYIRDADIAMYVAKKNGRAKYVFFSTEMKQQTIKFQDLEADFRRAIDNQQFELYYQPIISLATREVVRLEALVRWIHPRKGVIAPNDFIPLAEETGLIYPLGEFVLRRACEECRKWQSEGFANLGVAVNFSSMQFQFVKITELIKKVVAETGLNPKFLEIEITESVAMRNIHQTVNILQQLKEMKVSVVIDDFGTGYSSLSSLSEFSIDALKIDRKFVQNIPDSKHNASLTGAIISLAHNLGLKVVGEGIENQGQLDFLLGSQCEEGQGYFFAKPKPAAEVLKLIKESNIFPFK